MWVDYKITETGWKCPECGKNNKITVPFCGKCEHTFKYYGEEWECPKCEKTNPMHTLVCSCSHKFDISDFEVQVEDENVSTFNQIRDKNIDSGNKYPSLEGISATLKILSILNYLAAFVVVLMSLIGGGLITNIVQVVTLVVAGVFCSAFSEIILLFINVAKDVNAIRGKNK